MKSFWNNINLRTKFAFLFNGLLALFIMFLGASFYNTSRTERNFNELLNNDLAIVELAKDVRIHMLQTRTNEKNFMLKKKIDYLDQMKNEIQLLDKNLDEIIKIAGPRYGDIKKMAHTIEKNAELYLRNFEALVDTSRKIGLDQDSGLRGQLKKTARDLQSFVRQHQVDELYLTLLSTRKLEKEYIRTKSERILEKLRSALDMLDEILTEGSFVPGFREELNKNLAEYKEALNRLVAGEDDAYMDVIEHAVHMEKSIGAIYVQGARGLALDISLHESQYLLHQDPQELQETIDALDNLVDAFDNGMVDEKYLTMVEEKTNSYKRALLALHKNNQAINTITGTLEQTGSKVESMVENIVDTSHKYELNQRMLIEQNNRRTTIIILSMAILATSAGMLIVFLTIRSIVSSIREAVSFAGLVGDGDFTTTLDNKGRDEIGQLVESLNQMVRKLNTVFKKVGNSTEVLQDSATHLSESSEAMSQGADQSSEKANNVAAATEEMSSNMNSVAAACEEAATNVNIVADAVGELSATVQRIATDTAEARDVTMEAVTLASGSSEKVDALGQAAGEISKVTEVITEISEQTNLLALNATIEAARAGEAGKGFAVVANEIKELANQTADATREIKTKIEAIQNSTNLTVNEIKQVTGVITKVNKIVSSIATAVEEQTASTTEIAENIQQAALGISEVNENVAQSSAVSGDIAREIAEVSQVAGEITALSSTVKNSAGKLAKMADELSKLIVTFRTR
ncbi:HAMP domain-containing methyl-accepting chemotaxis protein [Desulfolithobacter sp.]